jgi:hypothetical protein
MRPFRAPGCCSAIFAIFSAAAAQLPPGTPHAFQVSTATPPSLVLDRVMPGEFDGDHRGDLALLVGGEVRVVYAAAGYGVSASVVAPGGGDFVDLAVAEAPDRGRHRLFALVRGGLDDGLFELAFDVAASPVANRVDLDDFANVDALEVHADIDAPRLFGVDRDLGVVYRASLAADALEPEPEVRVPTAGQRFRAAPLDGDKSSPQLIVEYADRLDVFDLAGSQVGGTLIPTGAALFDFAAGFHDAVGEGRIVLVVILPNGSSECRVHRLDGTLVQSIDFGTTAPRLVLHDLIDRGELDLVAVTSTASLGFASFAGLSAAPGSYEFTPAGTVLFGFPSPAFHTSPSFSNVAVFDFDYDGDRDVAFGDASMHAIWIQPSWIHNEIAAAPVVSDVQSLYSYQRPGAQDFAFAFTPPPGSFTPTHLELNVYQKKVVAGATQHRLVGSAFVAAAMSATIPGAYETGTVTVIAEYDGAQGTDADFVTAVRFLAAPSGASAWGSIGVEGFAEFHHSRTPHPYYPGYYITGSPGGVNPLPVVIGSGVVAPGTLPPAPPPPPGT